MKCNSCNITVNTNEDKCPVCNNPITGKKSSPFSSKNRKRSNEFTLKLLGFIFTVVSIINLFIDYKLHDGIFFSKYVVIGITFIYIMVYITLYNKDIFKILYKYSFCIMGYLLLLYLLIKKQELISIYIPCIIIVNFILSLLLSFIIKKKYIIKYLNITLIMIVISFINYAFVGIIDFKILIDISGLSGLTYLLYLLFFNHFEVKEKVKRFFNI